MEETPDSGDQKTSSQIAEFRRWTKDLVLITEPEFRPLLVIFIIACVFLVVLYFVGARVESSVQVILAIVVGAIGLLATFAIVILAFWNPSRANRVAQESKQEETESAGTLSSKERGIVALCVQVEKGKMKDTNRRHISGPLGVKQGTLVEIFKRVAGETDD